jgi:DinB family protein
MNEGMNTKERELVIDELTSSEARMLQLLADLTPAQWTFRESPERWSIADNIEHLAAFEHFIVGAVSNVLQNPPEPDKQAQAAAKQSLVLSLPDTRATKFNARESVRPAGRWPDTTELIAELRKARAATIAFAAETQADPHQHFFPHIAFGDLSCYQWLLVIARHTDRHARQIEQVKADPAFPDGI